MDTTWKISEKANEIMFDYLWPEHHAQHQYADDFDLDFKFNHDIWEYVGDYKFNDHLINEYDDRGLGLILEPTKYYKMMEEHKKNNYKPLYIRFCIDGVAIMNVLRFDVDKYAKYWNSANVPKTQEDTSIRQMEEGWYIPSTNKIWDIQYYTPEQKQMRDKILKWKEKQIEKIERQAAWKLFTETNL